MTSAHLGDNATVDELTDVIFYNEIATGLAEQLAYHIVHDLGRKVETCQSGRHRG